MSLSLIRPKLQFWYYRLSTVFKSFRTLCKLSPEKVDAFLNSYNIYDHDWSDEEAMKRDMGPNYYQEVQRKLVDYYSVLNHLCAIGQVEKMYIPPAIDLSASIIGNQNLFEEKMAKDIFAAPGKNILDIGCGRGRVASHVASLSGANVTGINIDPDQLASAEMFASSRGLSDRCHFQRGDLNALPLPFADASLDAVYQIQVFSLSKNLEALLKDIYRVLKPGGRLACLDWVHLRKYDATNPYHLELMKKIKPLIGAIGTISVEQYISALKNAGFEIVVEENASVGGYQAPLIEKADKFFNRVRKLIYRLVQWKILPAHFRTLFDRLTKDGEALIEADRLGLVTTTYYFLAEKK